MGFSRSTLLLCLVLSAGCHRWVPHDGTPVPEGTDVRVRVTDAGSDELQSRFGPNDGSVDGPVAYWNTEAIGLLVQSTIRRPGFPATTISDTIPVPSRLVSGVDVKTLDNRRTTALTAGIVLGGLGLVLATRAFGGEAEDGDPTPPPPDASWIVRFPLPLAFLFGGR